MSKRIAAKYKVSRRWGLNIWGRGKDPFERKNYRPGQHGPVGRGGVLSDFGVQLRAKQVLKGYYGNISEKQFRSLFQKASAMKGDAGENFVGLLERRLDAVVYRMNFVPTVFAARQFVSHKHVLVNGKAVNIPSYQVKEGDVIEVREKSRQIPMVIEASTQPERDIPSYLEVDVKSLKGTFARTPNSEEVPYPFSPEVNLVIEYYSR